MMNLTQEEIYALKQKLVTEKTELQEQLKKLKQELDFGDDVDHFEEEEDEAEEFANFLGVKTELEKRLKNIDAALAKIEAGSYGPCERCKTMIELHLLEIDPESRLCQLCKKHDGAQL